MIRRHYRIAPFIRAAVRNVKRTCKITTRRFENVRSLEPNISKTRIMLSYLKTADGKDCSSRNTSNSHAANHEACWQRCSRRVDPTAILKIPCTVTTKCLFLYAWQ